MTVDDGLLAAADKMHDAIEMLDAIGKAASEYATAVKQAEEQIDQEGSKRL